MKISSFRNNIIYSALAGLYFLTGCESKVQKLETVYAPGSIMVIAQHNNALEAGIRNLLEIRQNDFTVSEFFYSYDIIDFDSADKIELSHSLYLILQTQADTLTTMFDSLIKVDTATCKTEVLIDPWKTPQTAIVVTAPDIKALLAYLKDSAQQVLNKIVEQEAALIARRNSDFGSDTIREFAADEFGLMLNTSKGYKIVFFNDEENIRSAWIKKDENFTSSNILIHLLSDVEFKDLNNVADSLRRSIVTGEDSSYMRGKILRSNKISDDELVQTGWWRMSSGRMQGPFLRRFLRKNNDSWFVVEGFCFSPRYFYTPAFRELQVVINTYSL